VTKSIFAAPHFNDEQAAYDYVEARIWANGRVCPKCGVVDRSGRLSGKTDRPGLYKCYACRKKFTVKMGTVFEDSHILMRDWLTAIHLICSSKKGVSSNQLHRTLGITLKSAWFMSHRIREAMRIGALAHPMGSDGGIVEIDETFIGKKEGAEVRRGGAHKNIVLSLIERSGEARSFHVDSTKKEDIIPIVKANIAKEAHVMTDESNTYSGLGKHFKSHGVVDHSRKEYSYTDRVTNMQIGINAAEGYYSVFKRGMKGVYQHCAEKHLHRYVAEFDFRYSNRVKLGVDDVERADRALAGVKGKRLTYRMPDFG
jgi:transposase-like protein